MTSTELVCTHNYLIYIALEGLSVLWGVAVLVRRQGALFLHILIKLGGRRSIKRGLGALTRYRNSLSANRIWGAKKNSIFRRKALTYGRVAYILGVCQTGVSSISPAGFVSLVL